MIDYDSLPKYCSVRFKLQDINRAIKNNEEALKLLENITPAEIKELKEQFKNFKEEPIKDSKLAPIYTNLCLSYPFFRNYVFCEALNDDLKKKLKDILNFMNDLEIINDLVQNCRGFAVSKYSEMISRLCFPYSNSIKRLNTLFSIVYQQKETELNFGSGQIKDIKPIAKILHESPKTNSRPSDEQV